MKAKPSEEVVIETGEKRRRGRRAGDACQPEWDLWLYVAGTTPRSSAALSNLQRICEEYVAGHYHIEVIDLIKNPQIALADQILAVPTVVRKQPLPVLRVIGDLSNTERVLKGLDMKPYNASLPAASTSETKSEDVASPPLAV